MTTYRKGDKGTIDVTVLEDGPGPGGELRVRVPPRPWPAGGGVLPNPRAYIPAEAFTLTERAAPPLPPEPEWPHIVSTGAICWTALDGGLWRSTIGDRTWEHIWTHYRPVWPLVPGAPIGGDA